MIPCSGATGIFFIVSQRGQRPNGMPPKYTTIKDSCNFDYYYVYFIAITVYTIQVVKYGNNLLIICVCCGRNKVTTCVYEIVK